MSLYGRLMGLEDFKIPIHQFQALLAEFARNRLTGAQAQAAIEAISGAPLAPSEITEAQTLLGTITGTATARLARAKEIDDVLLLAEVNSVEQYDTPEEVKARLGV